MDSKGYPNEPKEMMVVPTLRSLELNAAHLVEWQRWRSIVNRIGLWE